MGISRYRYCGGTQISPIINTLNPLSADGNYVDTLRLYQTQVNNGVSSNVVVNAQNPHLILQDSNCTPWWVNVDTTGRPFINTIDELVNPPVPLRWMQNKNGINVMWPFMGPLVKDVNDPNTTYADNTFNNPTTWPLHVTSIQYGQLQRAKFDHLRIPVVPSPWMEAFEAGDATRMETLFQQYDQAVELTLQAGLGVLIDVHLSDFIITKWFVNTVLSDPDTFDIYNSVLKLFCERYSKYDPTRVAISLFNEPPDADLFSLDWPTCQTTLYNTARTAAPDHTLLLTCTSYSDVFEMVNFDPTPWSSIDNNVIFDCHLYIPPLFAIQGYYGSSFNKYIAGLQWPPNPSQNASITSSMVTLVRADSTLTSAQQNAAIQSNNISIGQFFDVPEDLNWMQGLVSQLLVWAGMHNVTLYSGESGCTRTNPGIPPVIPSYNGPLDDASRLAYLSDICSLIRASGINHAIFSADALDYGLTDQLSQNIGTFTQPVLDIISPGGVS